MIMERYEELMWGALTAHTTVPHEEWDFFRTLLQIKTIQKNNYFLKVGDNVPFIGFCVEGLFRLFYNTIEGNEYNKSFCSKGDFVTCYSAILQKKTATFSIQAVMESTLIIIPYQAFTKLFERHICWVIIAKCIAEQLYLNKEMREQDLLLLSAEERYLKFSRDYQHLVDHIPQYQIASYIGITPVALSRIRRKLT